MSVLVVSENSQFATKLLASEGRLRQHAVNRLLDHALGVLLEHRRKRREALMSHVAGVPEVQLLIRFLAGDANLRGVDHDDVVTGIHVRGVHRLVLATDDLRDFGRQTAEDDAFGVDDVPLVLDIPRGRGVCLHMKRNVWKSRPPFVRDGFRAVDCDLTGTKWFCDSLLRYPERAIVSTAGASERLP